MLKIPADRHPPLRLEAQVLPPMQRCRLAPAPRWHASLRMPTNSTSMLQAPMQPAYEAHQPVTPRRHTQAVAVAEEEVVVAVAQVMDNAITARIFRRHIRQR